MIEIYQSNPEMEEIENNLQWLKHEIPESNESSRNKKGLTKSIGIFNGPSGTETRYGLRMNKVIKYMRDLGYTEDKGYKFRIRKDGVKMFGPYVMVAANLDANNKERKKGTILETSLGTGIVCDKCERAYERGKEKRLDIAVDRRNNNKS